MNMYSQQDEYCISSESVGSDPLLKSKICFFVLEQKSKSTFSVFSAPKSVYNPKNETPNLRNYQVYSNFSSCPKGYVEKRYPHPSLSPEQMSVTTVSEHCQGLRSDRRLDLDRVSVRCRLANSQVMGVLKTE